MNRALAQHSIVWTRKRVKREKDAETRFIVFGRDRTEIIRFHPGCETTVLDSRLNLNFTRFYTYKWYATNCKNVAKIRRN